MAAVRCHLFGTAALAGCGLLLSSLQICLSLSLYISLRRQCGPRFFRRRREAPKTQSFRASTEDAKLQRRGASELQPKTRSSEDAELQKRRRGASELQSFRSFRSFTAPPKTRSFRASRASGASKPKRRRGASELQSFRTIPGPRCRCGHTNIPPVQQPKNKVSPRTQKQKEAHNPGKINKH